MPKFSPLHKKKLSRSHSDRSFGRSLSFSKQHTDFQNHGHHFGPSREGLECQEEPEQAWWQQQQQGWQPQQGGQPQAEAPRQHPKEEQKQRFLSRLDTPEKNWKFELGDIRERGHWDKYMEYYEDTLNETSREHAPWHCIPADNKPYMRMRVAEVVVDALRAMKLEYPDVADEDLAAFSETREKLLNES